MNGEELKRLIRDDDDELLLLQFHPKASIFGGIEGGENHHRHHESSASTPLHSFGEIPDLVFLSISRSCVLLLITCSCGSLLSLQEPPIWLWSYAPLVV